MLTVVMCAEDELAARVSQHLFKRALAEESTIDHVRANADTLQFVGLDGQPGWTLNRDLKGLLEQRERRIGVHPPRGLGGNGLRAYRIVRIAQTLQHEALVLLLLAYDRDGRPDAESLSTGVQAAKPSAATVVAEAQPEFDAWVLCGFAPTNELERTRLDHCARELGPLGIDPITSPEKLTSTVTGDQRDAKALAQRLLGLDVQAMGDEPRVLDCLDRPLAELRANGARAGLPEFLDETCRVVDDTQR